MVEPSGFTKERSFYFQEVKLKKFIRKAFLRLGKLAIGGLLANIQLWAQVAPKPALPRCNVGADPVKADRQPTSEEEVVINPADHVIRYKSGNGREVDCILEAGVPVVVSKTTGQALWVYGCGNDIVSTAWKPKQPTGGWGRSGSAGLTGPAGPQGLIGPTGPIGPAGPQGLQGIQGIPGLDGKDVVVRSRGHKKLYLVGGIIVGGVVGAIVHNNWPHKTAKAKPPEVVTKPAGPGVVTKPPG